VSQKPIEIEIDLVPEDHQYEMTYGESNGHMLDDVASPGLIIGGLITY